MPYPERRRHKPLPQFKGSVVSGCRPGRAAELSEFVVEKYAEGLSLRELGELTDRAWREIKNILDEAGVQPRPRGAPIVPGSRRHPNG